jgi:hypothetical protein
MTKSISLDALWDSATPTELVFNSDKLAHLPAAAKRYLEHAIAPGTKLASAVRLKMHGEIKLKKWSPFTAEQVICWEHGLIWSATAWMNSFLPIVGFDRIIDGSGTEFRDVDFGGILEEEGTFCGYTIPTRLRVGWYFGSVGVASPLEKRFESEGEFFRATIDDAVYR